MTWKHEYNHIGLIKLKKIKNFKAHRLNVNNLKLNLTTWQHGYINIGIN